MTLRSAPRRAPRVPGLVLSLALSIILCLAGSALAQTVTTTFQYDANGNPTQRTDPLNHSTVQTWDSLGRRLQSTDPAGTVQYRYDGQDRLKQVIDPRSLTTTYTVDGLGNVTQEVSPDRYAPITRTYRVIGDRPRIFR